MIRIFKISCVILYAIKYTEYVDLYRAHDLIVTSVKCVVIHSHDVPPLLITHLQRTPWLGLMSVGAFGRTSIVIRVNMCTMALLA